MARARCFSTQQLDKTWPLQRQCFSNGRIEFVVALQARTGHVTAAISSPNLTFPSDDDSARHAWALDHLRSSEFSSQDFQEVMFSQHHRKWVLFAVCRSIWHSNRWHSFQVCVARCGATLEFRYTTLAMPLGLICHNLWMAGC